MFPLEMGGTHLSIPQARWVFEWLELCSERIRVLYNIHVETLDHKLASV